MHPNSRHHHHMQQQSAANAAAAAASRQHFADLSMQVSFITYSTFFEKLDILASPEMKKYFFINILVLITY